MPHFQLPPRRERAVPGIPQTVAPPASADALPASVRRKMEHAFGHSFADVRIHSDAEAERIDALAYTRGTDLHFRPGLYDPFSRSGQEVLGHELAHVVQQQAGRVPIPQDTINADPRLEAEADALGARAARGERAAVPDAGRGGGRHKASGDAPIQCLGLGGEKHPGEFLQGSEEDDDFRLRMKDAMAEQKTMLATNDAKPASETGTPDWVASGPWNNTVIVQDTEKAKPEEFMAARAHLAASLTGANVGTLKNELADSQGTVNQWDSTAAQPVSDNARDAIYDRTLDADYTTAQRYQDQADHFKPRSEHNVSAVQQIRALHGDAYTDQPENNLLHSGIAYQGARHTKGFNESPFVSLANNPSNLLDSKDDGENGAKTIAQKASQLHTYTFPKPFGWDAGRLAENVDREPGLLDSEIGDGDQKTREWLSGTPTQEGEVLFLGGDLDQYRTKQEANPNLPRRGKRGKKR